MDKALRDALTDYIGGSIVEFHSRRLQRLEQLNIRDVLKRKNPYLFRAKNLVVASDLVRSLMDAFLSSSEEELFGRFLEGMAIFVSGRSCGGTRSSAAGLDLEFDREEIRYLVAIKSGPNWGNSSQQKALRKDFNDAVARQRQGRPRAHIQPVLGMCYGKTRDLSGGLYWKRAGQSFWHFLCGDPDLYVDIIEPIGHQAKQRDEDFQERRAALQGQLTAAFIQEFCQPNGAIDWNKLVRFNSGNLPQSHTTR